MRSHRSKQAEGDGQLSNPLSTYASDEEEAFFDCEEGERTALMKSRHFCAHLTGSRSHDSLHNSGMTRSTSGSSSRRKQQQAGKQASAESSRDLAVHLVETVFVLYEFSFWQVYQFYAYDLKELFNIEPDKVWTRICNSFLPGWHWPLLESPDLYGPLLAVFLLPQTLLLAMETSRHGCNPTSQLGNAVVVCWLIWLGLAALYRLLAVMVAPSIGIKQCLGLLGYSFYSWNLALLFTLPLEHAFSAASPRSHHPHPLLDAHTSALLAAHNVTHVGADSALDSYDSAALPMALFLPLVIFGVPCSLAQGYVFWEHTPASSMTLQPSSLPTSMQHFATQHSRCLQRLLWLFPKVSSRL